MRKFDPGGIKIMGNDTLPNYEDDVEKQLTTILKNPVGYVVLQIIDMDPRYIRIEPYTGGKACFGASTRPDKPRDAAPKNVRPHAGYGDGEHMYRDKNGRLVPSSREDLADYTGTGEGTDVSIQFTPGNYGTTACGGGKFGSQPDETLLHELIHGMRYMGGMNNPVAFTSKKLWLYFHEEEWWAIFIANIYIAVKNGHNRNLRANHEGFTELQAPWNNSEGFLRDEDHFKLAMKFLSQETFVTLGLSQIIASYNPVREYVENQHKYKP